MDTNIYAYVLNNTINLWGKHRENTVIEYGLTLQEHDKRLDNCHLRIKEKHLTLNKSKCEFNKKKT